MRHFLNNTSNTYRVELFLIIICACALTLKPLYDRVKRWRNPKRNSRLFLTTGPTYHPVKPNLEMIDSAKALTSKVEAPGETGSRRESSVGTLGLEPHSTPRTTNPGAEL